MTRSLHKRIIEALPPWYPQKDAAAAAIVKWLEEQRALDKMIEEAAAEYSFPEDEVQIMVNELRKVLKAVNNVVYDYLGDADVDALRAITRNTTAALDRWERRCRVRRPRGRTLKYGTRIGVGLDRVCREKLGLTQEESAAVLEALNGQEGLPEFTLAAVRKHVERARSRKKSRLRPTK